MTLTCSNIQGKIRSLRLIPSNIHVNYQRFTLHLVICTKSEQLTLRANYQLVNTLEDISIPDRQAVEIPGSP